ncbi:MAG TPA: CPBP family glutamic-type intramembrane protease [Candidatus Binatus sp.]|nr:CPBP family glutamic-type intramembrane protease [Candidatus Binatus sp.]
MDLKSLQQRARGSVALALAEFAIVAALFWADVHHHIYVSKTPYLFVLGWASLRLRGMRWKDVGFARPRSWGKALLLGCTVGVVMEALELFITQPLLARWLGKMPDLSDFADMTGNLKVFLFYMVLLWTLGALGEEIDYRGYLMNRVAGVFRDTKAAWVVSLIVVSIVFGCGHLDQGWTGMIENVWNGLLLGALYLACGRNLAVPVIAHAVGDTLDFLLIYLGKYPGMH